MKRFLVLFLLFTSGLLTAQAQSVCTTGPNSPTTTLSVAHNPLIKNTLNPTDRLANYQPAGFTLLRTRWAFLGYLLLAGVGLLGWRHRRLAQKESQERLKQALWGSEDELWNWDLESDVLHRIHSANQFRKELSEQTDTATAAFQSIHPQDVARIQAAIEDHLSGKTEFFEAQYRRLDKQGDWLWVIDRGRVVARASDGSPQRLAGTIKDIHKVKETEERLHLIAKSFENASNGVVVTDLDFQILASNPAFSEITGFSAEEALGSRFMFFDEQGADEVQFQLVASALDAKGRWQGEASHRHKSGRRFPISSHWDAVSDDQGKRTHYINVFSDITFRRNAESRLHHLANYDQLTGLGNRTLFKDRLAHAITRAERGGKKLALFFLDLDHFKVVNDSLGHAAGDILLRAVARRMGTTLRKVDSLARLGGDEFTIILENFASLEDVIDTAERVRQSFKKPFKLANDTVLVTISMGISLYPDDGGDAETLTKNADTAMHHAKKEGRRNFKFFTPEMNAVMVERMALANQLRLALEQREFMLYYQPKYDLNSGSISGFEALVRWQSQGKDLISPEKLIPVAEETGLIIPLGEFVLSEACSQTVAWLKQGLPIKKIAVNLSAIQFQQTDLVARVAEILEETGLAPHYLEFEITEGTLIKDVAYTIETLNQFRSMGIALAIDDFGTGYSSLSYLKKFPIQSLKIDQSFIRDLNHDTDDAGIVRAILDMARNLNLVVVAEGVESETHLHFLQEHGCQEAQGYLFSRPVPREEIPALFARAPIV